MFGHFFKCVFRDMRSPAEILFNMLCGTYILYSNGTAVPKVIRIRRHPRVVIARNVFKAMLDVSKLKKILLYEMPEMTIVAVKIVLHEFVSNG